LARTAFKAILKIDKTLTGRFIENEYFRRANEEDRLNGVFFKGFLIYSDMTFFIEIPLNQEKTIFHGDFLLPSHIKTSF
jgi:hypothetical protein